MIATRGRRDQPDGGVADGHSRQSVVALVLCGTFAVLAVVSIERPGLHYDEVFWANAAHGHSEGPFVVARLLGIPTYLMSYTGALKAWLYVPILELFGGSPLAVRLPMILVATAGLWLLYTFVRAVLYQRTALVVLALMVLSTSFVFHVRMDFGPVAIEFLVKVLGLIWAFRLVKAPSARGVAVLYLILLVGLFNKLNFIWFINALATGLPLFFWPEIRRRARESWQVVVVCYVGGYLVCLAYYVAVSRFFDIETFFSLSSMARNLRLLPGRLQGVISGLSFYEHFGDVPLRWSGIYVGLLLALTLAGGALLATRPGHEWEKRLMLFLAYVVVVVLAQVAATQQAGASWHYLMIYPMLAILLGYAIDLVYGTLGATFGRGAYIVGVLAFLGAFQGNVYLAYQRHFDVPRNAMWSPAIAELTEYAKSSPSRFVTVDWGIWNQLILADDDPDKYTSLEFFLRPGLNVHQTNWFVQTYLAQPGYLFVVHPPATAVFPEAVRSFFAIAGQRNLSLHNIKTIADDRGPVLEVYEVGR